MNVLEEGVLLLCCRLGDKDVKVLTMAQFRDLGTRVRAIHTESDGLRELNEHDLLRLGYDTSFAENVLFLLGRQRQLEDYLRRGEEKHIFPVTRLSAQYPSRFLQKQAQSRPTVLFAVGDPSLLENPTLAVVGSRQLMPQNEAIAKAAGKLAAEAGYVLVSGGARGADTVAQQACLEAGGSCVVFPADRLEDHIPCERVLYVSPDGYDIPFSPARALQRNRLIHMLADKTVAVQCSFEKGGTWQGCTDNLKHNWSELFVFRDGSAGANALLEQGAAGFRQLQNMQDLENDQTALF